MSLAARVQRSVWPQRGVAGRIGHAALLPLSLAFGCGVTLRNLGFRIGVLRAHEPPLPVISVGNLAVGGTGKTPFTLWLSQALQARGLRVAILLRGYGGRRSGVTVISRGSGAEVGAEDAGDEAVMLARRFSGVVITSPRRVEGARAAADMGCDVAVLDDGFQHRAIKRSMDLVLLDERRGSLLPAGPLRERLRALRRADAVVLVDRRTSGFMPGLPRALSGKPSYGMRFESTTLSETLSGKWQERPAGNLAGARAVAVCGIAQPEGFYRLLEQWDVSIQEVFEYPDHYRYTTADWQKISRWSQRTDFVVTTEKDLVKLEAFPFATGKLVALRIDVQVDRGDELIESVLEKIEGERASRQKAAPVADARGE